MRVNSDFLIIGSGIAGLSFALKASQLGIVHILTKSSLSEGATRYAQGGIAAVFSKTDSFENHIRDTLDAGAGLCNLQIVELTVQEGPGRVKELIDLGVSFTKRNTTNPVEYDLTKEGGHGKRRILHAEDFTGLAIEEALIEQVRSNKKINIFENHTAIDLITKTIGDKKTCLGMYALDANTQQIHTFNASFIILATGGAGKVYLYTSNPDVATGDGIAVAYRAGARVANMEFMQFHPTCLYHPKAKSFLISEALRGEGAELTDKQGHAFMKKYHPMGSLAPRDIVARAIDSEMKRTGYECVYLDLTKQDPAFSKTRFPNIYSRCLEYGIDFTKEPIPVVPAAHYMCGGVQTNEYGQTTIENLFAIGEVAHTGLHGANRLASNSLLEAIVFAHRAFLQIKNQISDQSLRAVSSGVEESSEWDVGMAVPIEEQINIAHTWRELRTLMWNYVGIVRSIRRLEKAQIRLQMITHEVQEYYWKYLLTTDLIELRNLVTVANLIVQSAMLRKESRGLHYNIDYPLIDDCFFKRDTVL